MKQLKEALDEYVEEKIAEAFAKAPLNIYFRARSSGELSIYASIADHEGKNIEFLSWFDENLAEMADEHGGWIEDVYEKHILSLETAAAAIRSRYETYKAENPEKYLEALKALEPENPTN